MYRQTQGANNLHYQYIDLISLLLYCILDGDRNTDM